MGKYTAELTKRAERTREFFTRDTPGDLLILVGWARFPGFGAVIVPYLRELGIDRVLNPEHVRRITEEYVLIAREATDRFLAFGCDSVPTVVVDAGNGAQVAAATGQEPLFDESTSWLEPELSWDEIARLQFDSESKWIQYWARFNRMLWEYWDEDFMVLTHPFKSPLDLANALRGTDLFLEMYTAPERVRSLLDWCTDWSIRTEHFLENDIDRPAGWNGVWDTWLPDRAVFINGDPVAMISPEMQREFDAPYNGRLFTATGGGYFHNHSVGIHQVTEVGRIDGILLQEVANDPNCPNLPAVLLNDSRMRDIIIESSLETPILAEPVWARDFERILDITKEGRFILRVFPDEDIDGKTMVERVRTVSALE